MSHTDDAAGHDGQPDRPGLCASHPEEAEKEIAEHFKSFWEKRMLAQIYAHIDAGAEGLDPLARQSLERIRQAKA